MLYGTSKKQINRITIIAFLSIPLSGFVTDIYLPSFPAMAKALTVSEREIQWTLTIYLLSYGISQLFIGSLLDSIGRYRPKLVALSLLIVSSVLISYTDSVFVICLWRAVQGIAISILVVATRALFADVYSGDRLKNYLSYFTMVWSCGPILAPFLGGYLEKLFYWQANFYFLGAYAMLLLILELVFGRETMMNIKKVSIRETLQVYKMMLQNIRFMLGIMILGLSYSIVMLFNITGPFIIEDTFHFTSVTIGYCTLVLGFSWVIGGGIAKKSMSLDFRFRVFLPLLVQLVTILGLLVLSFFYQNLYIMIGFAFVIHIISGVMFTSFFTNSMLFFPANAGTAGGLMGGLVYIITSVANFFISLGGTVATQRDLAGRYLILSVLLAFVVLRLFKSETDGRRVEF